MHTCFLRGCFVFREHRGQAAHCPKITPLYYFPWKYPPLCVCASVVSVYLRLSQPCASVHACACPVFIHHQLFYVYHESLGTPHLEISVVVLNAPYLMDEKTPVRICSWFLLFWPTVWLQLHGKKQKHDTSNRQFFCTFRTLHTINFLCIHAVAPPFIVCKPEQSAESDLVPFPVMLTQWLLLSQWTFVQGGWPPGFFRGIMSHIHACLGHRERYCLKGFWRNKNLYEMVNQHFKNKVV